MNVLGEHRAELVRGLVSAGVLACLLIGLPILLATGVGWPLPREIPSSSEAVAAIKAGAVSSSFVLKALSLVLWILWGQMVASLGVELWAHSHGRVVPRVVFIPRFMQRLSARIMGTALVITFSLQHPTMAVTENQELLAPTTIEVELGDPWDAAVDSSETSAGALGSSSVASVGEAITPEPLIHTVERRDSLRMLAERYLGDANRWTEVFVLNQGNTQAVGGSLSDPARLTPGWELVLPADARSPEVAEAVAPDMILEPPEETMDLAAGRDGQAVVVQSGDTLWGLADQHLQDPEKWVDIFNANRDTIQDPSQLTPGWELQLPTSEVGDEILLFVDPPAQAAEVEAPIAAYTSATPVVVAPVAPASVAPAPTPNSASSHTQTMVAIGGLGVFASSLGWLLARLRRIQRRRFPNDRKPESLSSEAMQVGRQLPLASDPDQAHFLDASLRVMSSRIGDTTATPQVIGASLSPTSVSIVLDAPCAAPGGFTATDGGLAWVLSREATLEPLLSEADGVPAPLPTLVTVGERDGDEFLLNLEHCLSLNLEGDEAAIEGLCAAMATQLASSHLADDLTVLCVGFGQDLSVFDRVEHAPDVAAAIEQIARHQRQNRALLGNHPPSVETRIGHRGDYWHPTVVLAPDQLTNDEAASLLDACAMSVCIVGHGLEGASWSGYFDDRGLLLEPIGLRVEPYGLSHSAVTGIAELVSAVKGSPEVPAPQPPVPSPLPATAPSPPLAESPIPVSPPVPIDVEVQVMGTVDILGAATPLTSRRALDLVAYLAFHPEGADRDQLKAHVWPPDEPPTESTLSNTVSRARKALGNNDNGEPYLPRVSTDGIYRLRPEVGTDVSRFEALVAAARENDDEQGRHQLLAAFDLVRGTPFTGGTGNTYRWADFGLRTHIECLVDAAAHELAERCLSVGALDGARRAAMTSLRLVGVCEQCYRLRMLAAANNPTEVRQIMAELMSLLNRENKSSDTDNLISPELLELYDQLISNPTAIS